LRPPIVVPGTESEPRPSAIGIGSLHVSPSFTGPPLVVEIDEVDTLLEVALTVVDDDVTDDDDEVGDDDEVDDDAVMLEALAVETDVAGEPPDPSAPLPVNPPLPKSPPAPDEPVISRSDLHAASAHPRSANDARCPSRHIV
jgi:hypothetical protein